MEEFDRMRNLIDEFSSTSSIIVLVLVVELCFFFIIAFESTCIK